nr:MAG: RNA-dependent RNA polymerase [Crogonang virus 38]
MTGAQFAKYEHKDYPALDLTFVDFSAVCVQAHRDIVKYCVTDRDVVKELKVSNNNFGVRLDIARPLFINDAAYVERIAYVSQGLRYDPRVTVGYSDTEQLWTYNMPTQCGDCGAPLTIAEPRYFGGKSILGIHVAGKSRTPANGGQRQGWSAILTKELVEKALTHFHRRNTIEDTFHEDLARKGVEVIEETEVVAECGLAEGSMVPLGLVPGEYVISQSTNTKIKETGFKGFGDSPVAQAIMRPVVRNGEIVEPMRQALSNYATPLHKSHIPRPNATMGLAMQKHWNLTANSTRRILTTEEAVIGVPHMKLKSINRSSSCGYPYNIKYAKGKTDIFGDGDEFDLERPAAQHVLSEVEGIIEDAKKGIRRAHVFVDFLKDETRPLAKVEAVATRAISGAPVDYSIAVRKYFGAFMSSVHLNHTLCGMAPGINHYTEWDVLANELLRHGERVFAGDFKAFDASEQPDIHQHCLRYINSWYAAGGGTPEDDLVREVLFQDLIHSRHLTGIGPRRDSIVQWNKSLPSGHPLTTIINSMYSLFTITACYVKRTGDYISMWDKVYICTYGDDNVVGVSDEVSEVFNQVTVAEDMKDFGLVYTSDRKDGVITPYESISDITFLKRAFRRAEIEGGWCGPLNMDSILFRTYFYHNNRSFKKDLETNFYDAMLELSLHDETQWGARYEAALLYCTQNGLSFPIQSREQARELCFARTDVWY